MTSFFLEDVWIILNYYVQSLSKTGDKAQHLCSPQSVDGREPCTLRPLNVVVVHGFSRCVAVMQEEYGHSPKHSHAALSPFGDLLPDGLHADVSRQLAFTSRGVDSGWKEGTLQTRWACFAAIHSKCGKCAECTKNWSAKNQILSSQTGRNRRSGGLWHSTES